MKAVFEAVGFVVGLCVAIALNAWVLSMLYGWFVLPVFTSAPRLSTMKIAGVALFVRALRGWRIGPKGEGPAAGELLAAAVAMDLLMLAAGGCLAFVALS